MYALNVFFSIEGCYNISLIRNSLNRDEHVAENSPFCQMKCMNRQYFTFSQKVSLSVNKQLQERIGFNFSSYMVKI